MATGGREASGNALWTPNSLAIRCYRSPCFHQLPAGFSQHTMRWSFRSWFWFAYFCPGLILFLSLWCHPAFFFFADDCYICLWFLTTLFFLCLAGIKSLMFQNHIQLKLCETEFLVSSSLKLQRWCRLPLVSGLCWPPISLQTGIMGVIFDW